MVTDVHVAPEISQQQADRAATERVAALEQEAMRSRAQVVEVPDHLKHTKHAVPILELFDVLLKLPKAKTNVTRRRQEGEGGLFFI